MTLGIQRPLMPRLAVWVVGVAILLLSGIGCDSRAREARSRLDPERAQAFDLGRKLSVECWSCHDFYNRNNKIGPHLVGVLGRRVGEVAHFSYSEAMKSKAGVWDERSLRAFLRSPSGFIPGTTMASRGIVAEGQLDALLLYIGEVTRE